MNPLLMLAIAAGAYWVGTRMGKPDEPAPAGPLPLPPPPEGSGLGEVPTSPEGAANLAEWEALEFDVDVFPADAKKQAMRPPRTYEGVSIAPGCAAIAVGHGFWEKLGVLAQPELDDGRSVQDTWEAIRGKLFPGLLVGGGGGPPHAFFACLDDDAPAALLLAAEIISRIRFLSGPFITAAPAVGIPAVPYEPASAGGVWEPVGNPSLPSMRDAVLWRVLRRRRR